jgi:hypothetical protein
MTVVLSSHGKPPDRKLWEWLRSFRLVTLRDIEMFPSRLLEASETTLTR